MKWLRDGAEREAARAVVEEDLGTFLALDPAEESDHVQVGVIVDIGKSDDFGGAAKGRITVPSGEDVGLFGKVREGAVALIGQKPEETASIGSKVVDAKATATEDQVGVAISGQIGGGEANGDVAVVGDAGLGCDLYDKGSRAVPGEGVDAMSGQSCVVTAALVGGARPVAGAAFGAAAASAIDEFFAKSTAMKKRVLATQAIIGASGPLRAGGGVAAAGAGGGITGKPGIAEHIGAGVKSKGLEIGGGGATGGEERQYQYGCEERGEEDSIGQRHGCTRKGRHGWAWNEEVVITDFWKKMKRKAREEGLRFAVNSSI